MTKKTKIALIGFGKMGKEIDALCNGSENFEVVSINYREKDDKLDLEGIRKADVAIDFTSPEVVIGNIEAIAKLGVNMVIGTTGWYAHMGEVKKIADKYKIGILYGQNFSVGANIFFKIAAFAAGLFAKFPEYDAYGLEIHHKAKLDSPSGTALKISDEIKKNSPYKINFASIRAGRNPGFHEVVFDSNADSVTMSHQAFNRTGFGKGALVGAQFIKNKKGVYSFEDALNQ